MKLLFTLLLGLLPLLSFSQIKTGTEKLDQYFDSLDRHQKFMGRVSVRQNGETLYSVTKGYADLTAKKKATPSTGYKIGSISKTFTAVLVFQAIEKGMLSLDQTLEYYFPEIMHAPQITIAQMLSHRSGIPNFLDNDYSKWFTVPKTREEMLKKIASMGSAFQPGSQSGYSNSNYLILSYILEKIHQDSYASILRKHITLPLELSHTYLGEPSNPEENVSRSYTFSGRWVEEPDTHSSVLLGAGAIVSTADDLNTFFENLFSGKLISYSNLEKMRPLHDHFGMGLIRFPFYNQTGYGHAGNIDGFNSVSIYFPADNLTYSLVSNGCNYVLNNISLAVLSAAYHKPYDLPEFTRITLTPEELDPYLGTYSSPSLPITLSCVKQENFLAVQVLPHNQTPVGLEAVRKHQFVYEKEGINLFFNPENGTVTLKQGGDEFILNKE